MESILICHFHCLAVWEELTALLFWYSIVHWYWRTALSKLGDKGQRFCSTQSFLLLWCQCNYAVTRPNSDALQNGWQDKTVQCKERDAFRSQSQPPFHAEYCESRIGCWDALHIYIYNLWFVCPVIDHNVPFGLFLQWLLAFLDSLLWFYVLFLRSFVIFWLPLNHFGFGNCLSFTSLSP